MNLTPVQQFPGSFWAKRDDLYTFAGVSGGKVRTCRALASRGIMPLPLVTASSRMSPQLNIVAHIAKEIGQPSFAFIPASKQKPTYEMISAQKMGMEFREIRPGYNTVIINRAETFAEENGYNYIPFGMECQEAVEATAAQVSNLPQNCTRLVVPVGSGMSLAGILRGLERLKRSLPVLGVVVGASPIKRLNKYAPVWNPNVQLVNAGLDYHDKAPAYQQHWNGIDLDPIYEAKCVRFLKPGDCLWIVGVRELPKPDFDKEYVCQPLKK